MSIEHDGACDAVTISQFVNERILLIDLLQDASLVNTSSPVILGIVPIAARIDIIRLR